VIEVVVLAPMADVIVLGVAASRAVPVGPPSRVVPAAGVVAPGA
jgi:hypothetical protein